MKKNNGNVMTEMKEFAIIQCGEYPDKIDFLVAENVGDGEFIQTLNEESKRRIIAKFERSFYDEECRSLCDRLKRASFFKVLYKTDCEAVAYGVRAIIENQAKKAIDEIKNKLNYYWGSCHGYADGFLRKGRNVGKFLVYLVNDGFYKMVDSEWESGCGKIICESKDLFVLEGNRTVNKIQPFYFQKIVGTAREAEKYDAALGDIMWDYDNEFEERFGETFHDEMGDSIEEAVAQPA